MVYGRTAQSHNLHQYIFLSKNTDYMKKSFLSFVAVIVGFFVSLELSAFKLTVSPDPGEVESLSSLTFYHETSGKQLFDSGNYAKLITVCKEDGTEVKSFHFGNFTAGDGFLYRKLTEEAFGEPITEAGIYYVKVPAGFFNQNFLGTIQCEEQTFTYTVTGGSGGGTVEPDPDPEPGTSDLTAAEIAAKLAGDYLTKRSGETRVSAGVYEAYSKEYENSIIADGDDIIIINADGNSNDFRGIIDPEKMTVYFDRPKITTWWTGNSSQDYSTGFYAEIAEDFFSLTFEEWHKVYNNTNWESSTSHVMTKLAELVLEWEVEGNINWTGADDKSSSYVSDLQNVKFTKYTRGEEATYKLETIGGAYYNAPSMEFKVVDGKIAPTNWGDYQRYLYIENGYDMLKPKVENSTFEGDAEGGTFSFSYDYYSYYVSSYPDESGTMTFTWGTYIKEPEVEPFLPEYVTDPAEGSVLNVQVVNDISIEFPGYIDIYYGYGSKIEVKDAEGNELYTNAYFDFRDYNYSKLYITNLGLIDAGTYTVVVKGGSLYVTSDWSNYQNITEDISVTFTIAYEWDGSVVLPDYVTTTDELLNLPVTFPDAREVDVTNFGALGAVFDETGSVFALLFPDANAGGIDVDGATANVRFEKMSTLRAQNAALAESLAQRIGGFVQPESGVATVFICPKSFKVNGTLYTEAITKTYEVAGSGQSTAIENVETSNNNATIYDIQGRRTTSATKGIIIRNGVKEIK